MRPPATHIERLVLSMIESTGVMPLPVIVARVARQLYLDAVHRGAWLWDTGLLTEHSFVDDVTAELEAANGALWAIGVVPADHRARETPTARR